MSAEGAVRFARYAYPPNALGYCGPVGSEALLLPDATDEIERRARQFEGAWSYLEVLAEATALDPLADEVVEAYWLGSDLLDEVDPAGLVRRLENRFRGQVGGTWRTATTRATAHHGFQVYEVYPWAGLLLAGRTPGPAVTVLDRCRIRVGEVIGVEGEQAFVASRLLAWDGTSLGEGEAVTETVRWSVAGCALIDVPPVGSLVALHWDWVCEVVSPSEAMRIEHLDRRARMSVGLSPAAR
jgi:hypothetical protein